MRLSQHMPRVLPMAFSILATALAPCFATTLYSFGNPTADEQYYIELINRARANPPAEGVRLATTTDPFVLSAYAQYGVNLTTMQTQFNAIAVQPPLAPNASLMTSARGHSTWMFNNQTQSHDETNPANTFDQRITAAGYNWQIVAENIYAYAKYVSHGHAGFEVDWGGSAATGGMQSPPGHRNNIHNSQLREIGVGVVNGINGTVGPQLVTQDFGTQYTSPPTLGTGVAYYDLNGNNAYDSGEGISGLTVNVSGASYYCTTATGGGWTMPVPDAAGTHTVTFTGLNINQSVNLTVPAYTNAKADLQLSYVPPTITSGSTGIAGTSYALAFNAVGGATSYKWNRWNPVATSNENCESTANVTTTTTGSYSILSSTTKQEGSSSFHLLNLTGASQIIQLNTLFYGQGSPSVSFQSKLCASTTSEHFKMQVKDESSSTWQDAYDQAGGGTAESAFNLRSATLTSMAGKAFRVRFILFFPLGTYSPNTGDGYGWFIDAISFSGMSALTNNSLQSLSTTTGSFTPAAGTYVMTVTPVISGNDFPASSQVLTVSVALTPQTITFGSLPAKNYGAAAFQLAATASSGLAVSYASSNTSVATVSGTTVTITGVGNSTITASQAGNSTYAAASDVQQTLTVGKGPQTITFGTLPAKYYGDAAFNPGATASSGLTPTYTSSNTSVATVSGTTVTIVGAGTSTITAAQAGNSNYNAATSAQQTLTVGKGSQTITFGTLPAKYYGDASFNPGATASSGLTPTYTSSNTSVATVSGTTVTIAGAGTSTITASQAGNSNYNAATSAQQTLTVNKASQTITFGVLPVKASGGASFNPGATASSGLAVSYASSIPQVASVSGSLVTPSGIGATVITASQSGNQNYKAATAITQTLIVTGPSTYAAWSSGIETANGIAAGTLANHPNGDQDHDGRSNLIEYAFRASPVFANDPAPYMPVLQSDSNNYILRYQRDTALTDVTFTPQASSNLRVWLAPGDAGAPAGFTDVLVSTSGTVQTREARIPRTSGKTWFFRIRVTKP